MAQSLLQIPYALNPEAVATAMTTPDNIPNNILANRRTIHTSALRLIATERWAERQQAWKTAQTQDEQINRSAWLVEWNGQWKFTAARREQTYKRHPLALRTIARKLMQIINDERVGSQEPALKDGTPLYPPIHPVTLAEIAAGRSESPLEIEKHLSKAGYGRSRVKGKTQLTTRLADDARRYLIIYPPVPYPQSGELNRSAMATAFDASDNLILRIIRDKQLYPVVRMLPGRGGREAEFYEPEEVASIRQGVEELPLISQDEVPWRNLVGQDHSKDVMWKALQLSGIPLLLRRQLRGKSTTCVRKIHIALALQHYQDLITLRPGEMGSAEIEAALDITQPTVAHHITPYDIQESRLLHEPGIVGRHGRRVFPPHVVRRIMLRMGFEAPEDMPVSFAPPRAAQRRRPAKKALPTPPDYAEVKARRKARKESQPSPAVNTEGEDELRQAKTPPDSPRPVLNCPKPVSTTSLQPIEKTTTPQPPKRPGRTPAKKANGAVKTQLRTRSNTKPPPTPHTLPASLVEETDTSPPEPPASRTISEIGQTLNLPSHVVARWTGKSLRSEELKALILSSTKSIPLTTPLPPDAVARIARNIITERMAARPSTPLTIQQIALVTSTSPGMVRTYLRSKGLYNSELNEASYNNEVLEAILGNFGVSLRKPS